MAWPAQPAWPDNFTVLQIEIFAERRGGGLLIGGVSPVGGTSLTLYGCFNGWGVRVRVNWGAMANNFLPVPPTCSSKPEQKQEICFKWDGKTVPSTMKELRVERNLEN